MPLLLAAALVGCGGDDDPGRTTQELPDLAVPTTSTTPPATVETAPPASTTVDPATETLPEEGPAPDQGEQPADTPENDSPPPGDSPAERFEEYCNENPGACG